jgi:hypothetical protein
MRSIRLWFFLHLGAILLAIAMCVSTTTSGQAQVPPGGMDGATSDQSRTPFRIKLSGFLNTKPEEGSKVLTLGISTFGETYQFELVKAEAVDDKQIGEMAILQQVGKYPVDFDLVGTRDLLSKVGQAEPGSPLAITGFFTQRNRKLQIEKVEVIGLDVQ